MKKETSEIIASMVRYLGPSSKGLLTNVFWGRYERDLLRWGGDSFLEEYEVKVSRGDFLSDFRKKKNKHLCLKGGAKIEVNKFSFVAPSGIIKLGELPLQYGLISINEMGLIRVERNPQLLHTRKGNHSKYFLGKYLEKSIKYYGH